MEQLASLRKKAGFTQASLAEKLGVTQMAVSHWESGRRAPSIKTLCRIAESINVPVVELLSQPTHRNS